MTETAPVAIFGFNRPATTAQVFERVRQARPAKLFLCLDAPRLDHPADDANCADVKRLLSNVDWPCEVHRNYAAENMGCRWRMTTGISWVFEHVEEAILLEDDCVPHLDFFRFCTELLDRYRQDTRIGMIAGHIAHRIPMQRTESYYFDRFNAIWGWATWKRAWTTFDQGMQEWPRVKQRGDLRTVFVSPKVARSFAEYFDQVCSGASNSWATAWYLSCLRQGFLCIHPSVNLITNIGVVGTHNRQQSDSHFTSSNGIAFPLKHPADFLPSYADEAIMRKQYTISSFAARIVARATRLVARAFASTGALGAKRPLV